MERDKKKVKALLEDLKKNYKKPNKKVIMGEKDMVLPHKDAPKLDIISQIKADLKPKM